MIDADLLIQDTIQEYARSKQYRDAVTRMVNKAPTIEPKRGEWKLFYESKDGDNVYQCSCCRFITVIPEGIKLFSFCPNCGADMREREGE